MTLSNNPEKPTLKNSPKNNFSPPAGFVLTAGVDTLSRALQWHHQHFFCTDLQSRKQTAGQ